jgi:hypothetical protein
LHTSGLSFTTFAARMALPWPAALAIEWRALSPAFAAELRRPHAAVIAAAL